MKVTSVFVNGLIELSGLKMVHYFQIKINFVPKDVL